LWPLQREPGGTVSGNHLLAAIPEEEVMKKAAVVLLALAVVLIVAPAAFAQGTEAAKPPINPTTLAIAVGFGVAVAAFGGGLGQGRIAAAACEGIARNPGAAGGVRAAMILGLVFVETLTLFTFALGFLLYLKL
jgi:F-type H+-transporting ATPase subunit c